MNTVKCKTDSYNNASMGIAAIQIWDNSIALIIAIFRYALKFAGTAKFSLYENVVIASKSAFL